ANEFPLQTKRSGQVAAKPAGDTQSRKLVLHGAGIVNVERAMLAYPANLWLINRYHATNGYGAKMSPRNQSVTLTESQLHVIDPTNPGRALDDSIKHRLYVRGRTADDAKHFGGRRLMFQGLTEFGVALLDLLEQAHVFNRDHCLVGEGFKESDLFVCERPNLGAADRNSSNRNTFSQQRHDKHCPSASPLLGRLGAPKVGITLCCEIIHVHCLSVNYGPTGWPVSTNRYVFLRQQNMTARRYQTK